MSLSEWFVSIALILLVARQLRGRRVTVLGLIWPVALVVWATLDYLRPAASGVADGVLVATCTAVGLGLGAGCGALSRLTWRASGAFVRATPTAALLWMVGMVGRLAFGLWATNGGGPVIARLSAQLDLRTWQTWSTALTAMALAEVCARTVVLLTRMRRTRPGLSPVPASPAPTGR